ncbi:uncharacterized protein LOC117114107 isoform X2 [Anneissia japonica]|uniref:uncharacterized protein LOC117114107 isoform X2 n=1 Tax=Anneissia japonica TaxID=1529436 RepID=UPI0014256CCA|nr:uncharacterized protein LOC117114107 isoform X2 [Anneissia japonica]XP_033113548.1 uncharacterized protein LOC117114107 isoform X2 [Anneissia japonica]
MTSSRRPVQLWRPHSLPTIITNNNMSTCFTLKTPSNHTATQITNIHQPITSGGGCKSCVIEQLNARLTPVSQRLLRNPTGRQYPVLAITRRDLQSTSGVRHMQTHNRMSLSLNLKSTKNEAIDNGFLVTSNKHDANMDSTTSQMRQTSVYEESGDSWIMNDPIEIDQIQDPGISKTSLTPPEDSLRQHEERNMESEHSLHDPDKLDMFDVMKMVNKKLDDRDTCTRDSHKGKIQIKFNMKPTKIKRTPTPSVTTFKTAREGSTRHQNPQSGSNQGFTMITKSKTAHKLYESRINLDNDLKYPRTVSSYSVTNSSLWNDRVAQQKHRLNILNSQTKYFNKTIKGSLDKDILLKTQQTKNVGEEGKASIHKHATPHCVPLLFNEMASHLPEPHSFWGEYSPGRTSPRTAATIAFKRGLIQPDECTLNNWHCGRKRIPPLPQGGAPGLPRLDLLNSRTRSHNVARLHMKTGRTTRENSLMIDLETKKASMNNLDAKKDVMTNLEDEIPEHLEQVPDFSVEAEEPFTPANTPISWQYYSDEPDSAFVNSMTVSDSKENKAKIHVFLPEMS